MSLYSGRKLRKVERCEIARINLCRGEYRVLCGRLVPKESK